MLHTAATAGLALAAVVACTPSPRATEPPASGSAPTGRAPSLAGTADCFFARDAQDFRVLSRSALIVYAPDRRRAYRVEFAPPSFALSSANGIAFNGGGGRVCGNAGERLLVEAGGRPESLSVLSVRRLDPAAEEAATRPREPSLPAPQPGPGPVVETGDGDGESPASP